MARSQPPAEKPPRKGNTRKPGNPPEETGPVSWDERLADEILNRRREIGGVFFLLFAGVSLLALFDLSQASLLQWWTRLLRQIFGWGAIVICLAMAVLGLRLIAGTLWGRIQVEPTRVAGAGILVIIAMGLAHLVGGYSLVDAVAGRGGGLVGWALAEPLFDFFGPFLTILIYLALLGWAMMLLTGRTLADIQSGLMTASRRLSSWADQVDPDRVDVVGRSEYHPPPATVAPPSAPALQLPPDEADGFSDTRRRDPRLPSIDLLERGETLTQARDEIAWKSKRIEDTLFDFGLPAKVVEVRRGPTVTQFGVEPGYVERPGPDGEMKQQKVRVGQIAALQRDLTLALAVSRLRIEAPVPGRNVVGIEVPNGQASVVRLRGLIESPAFARLNSPLSVGLGRNVAGDPVVADLGKLPHLLIAGTTGSGKSVCINAFISCLVFNNTPEQLKLVMVDPKKVELVRFNGLPHLIGNVEVDADRAVGVLRWLTSEMDRRYELFESVSARNISIYNHKHSAAAKAHLRLPYIAVFIDELADLMHMYPGDVERNLCRLAQMARATGIHLIVATQRPSTDVITGLIKANFPARLSFAVASGTDSRVILDTVGAEHLLGKGDMLFQSPDAGAPDRVQGVYVTDTEIERVVAHWRAATPNHAPEPPPWEPLIARYALLDETDSLLESAVELAKKHDNLSVSFLQRRLRLGYPRAARLMEHLHEMGLVDDPQTGGKTRRSFVNEDDEDPIGDYLSDS
ncbi:MAG TPA: DNA translocase FtsK [Promineifilum sp.]|nr:DNA translocase FtsK [Promineifilum sp.]HRO90835.1 DNA translocase FtsK [Promineifilum sp.]HRQ13268.1 DNA translocase FtsK [Promineifilum sp.]